MEEKMVSRSLLASLEKQKQFKEILLSLESGCDVEAVAVPAVRPLLIGGLAETVKQKVLVIAGHHRRAEQLSRDISSYTSLDCYLFPDWEVMPGDTISPGAEISGQRLSVLSQLHEKQPLLVVADIRAVMRRFPPFEPRLSSPLALRSSDEIALEELTSRLSVAGYVRSYLVESRGQFSVRGGVVDIFPATAELPVRLEFFGDRIESLRQFLVASQRSVSTIEEVSIFPTCEVILTPERARRAIGRLKEGKSKSEQVEKDIARLEQLTGFEGIERYLPFLYEKLDTLHEYFLPSDLVILDERSEIEAEADRFYRTQKDSLEEAPTRSETIGTLREYFISYGEIPWAKQRQVSFSSFRDAGKKVFSFSASAAPAILGKTDELSSTLQELRQKQMATVFVLPDEGTVERLAEILVELGLEAVRAETGIRFLPGRIYLAVGDLSQGFVSSEFGLSVLAESDVFFKRRVSREKRMIEGLSTTALFDLKKGDYVVHVRHGIARFGGLAAQTVAGTKQEYLVLEYAAGDRLYVPADQIDRVSKFLGAEGTPPKITRLGSGDWQRAKKRASHAVKKLAFDLLKLYVVRGAKPGFAFSPDTIWQKELEGSFAYPETRDQIRAIDEVGEDMERPRPMDRLICGDVGYGKTEVAVRASFKAVLDNRQVMVLVPTTILAQQHFNTFRERLASFPLVVEMLSRFRSSREQKEILKRFTEGKVDILIGTHRLLQKDVFPKNLGLVIVDEEQRFGVGHKEHLRDLRQTVDVLTLSATPIPRTLQMSLSGVRDLSIINTPPEERKPVITQVSEFNEETIKAAIERELQRQGQVFFVHNRVETIDQTAERVRELVPEAQVAVAHGQMAERHLELIMLDFLSQKSDVLACTTIIESGIDIPTANTLIVDEAENLGLSQLYQLRGRVGRAHHRAYAYFFYSSQKLLTATALDRLKTIAEFTELSSGLKIAIRDLEIRGAGNLLGPEQHGLVQAVGFVLYCAMLRQAITDLKGLPPDREIETRVGLPVDAFIPLDYIGEETARLEAYRQISAIKKPEEAKEVEAGLLDVYGPLPPAVKNLVDICRLKVRAANADIKEIGWQSDHLTLSGSFAATSLSALRAAHPRLTFLQRSNRLVVYPLTRRGILNFLSRLLDDIIPPSIDR